MDFSLTSDEQELQRSVERLAEECIAPMAEEVDESDRVSPELMAALAGVGLPRYYVPEEYGRARPEKGNRIENLYREVRALTIDEGTSEIQRQRITSRSFREGTSAS